MVNLGPTGPDPRWDWCDVRTLSDPGPVWIKGACKHLDPLPVDVTDPVTGDVLLVARLCPDCDTQLETGWTQDVIQDPNGFERWAYAPDHPAGTQETARLALKDGYPDIGVTTFEPGLIERMRDHYLTTWGVMKTGVLAALDFFFETFAFMWPLYLVGLNFTLGVMYR